jgi:hypothetical protein
MGCRVGRLLVIERFLLLLLLIVTSVSDSVMLWRLCLQALDDADPVQLGNAGRAQKGNERAKIYQGSVVMWQSLLHNVAIPVQLCFIRQMHHVVCNGMSGCIHQRSL